MINGIYLLLGTNLGDKKHNLSQAISLIAERIGTIENTSSIYETAAWGKTEQPTFLNQVIELRSEMEAFQILNIINAIESEMGRIRKEKWGERLIDIDILYYNQVIVKTEDLEIPHPGIPDRRFTLVPLVEIAPDFLHPQLKLTNTELLEKCPDSLEVKPLKKAM